MKNRKIDFKKPLKIYLIADNFRPCFDGMTKTTDLLATGFKNDGYDVTVICPYKKDYIDDVPYKVMRTPSFLSKSEYPISKRYFSKQNLEELESYDGPIIFHSQTPFLLGHLARRYARKHSIPFIATSHTKYKDDFYGITRSKILTKLAMNYTVKYFNNADEVITVSSGSADVLKEYGCTNKIKTIVTGTNIAYPSNKEQHVNEIRAKYNISKDENVLLFVGHLTWQKGIKLILDSIKEAEDKYDMKFVAFFVGDGNRRNEIIKYNEKLKLKSRTYFTGNIADVDTFKSMYLVADLFFFPSDFDTLGLVIHEAATFSLPSLLIEGSICACFTKDNENGFLAKSNKESMAARLHEIFLNKNLLPKIGENAKRTIPRKINDTIKETEEEYLKLIKSFYKNK